VVVIGATGFLLRRERLCGAAVLLVGAFGLSEAMTYPLGRLIRMGPGYLPIAFSGLMVLFGLAILADGWSSTATVARVRLRPLLAVLSGLLAWAILAEPAGFVAATMALIVLSSLAEPGARLLQTLLLAAGVSLAGGLLFVKAFAVPLPLFPF